MGSMFAVIFFIRVQAGSSVRPVVGIERTVYYREKGAGMNSSFPYTFAQVIKFFYYWIQLITSIRNNHIQCVVVHNSKQ